MPAVVARTHKGHRTTSQRERMLVLSEGGRSSCWKVAFPLNPKQQLSKGPTGAAKLNPVCGLTESLQTTFLGKRSIQLPPRVET